MMRTTASQILSSSAMAGYVESFVRNDQELYHQHIPNVQALDWMRRCVPLFECPDKAIEEIYYFRWWTYRKHIKATPDGFVVTEFLPPEPWAGKHNTISCAAGHHFREGRWLRDSAFLDDYADFWLRKGGDLRSYSFWIADSLLACAKVSGRYELCCERLPELIANHEAWERDHRDPNGLFWQRDDRDGMEWSISGKLAPLERGYRATINSYLYGDALAIAEIADRVADTETAERFRAKAAEIKRLTQQRLWDSEACFFKVLPRVDNPKLADVRELHGYTPWYFNLPDPEQSVAWSQLMDPSGFYAPFGPTTAERRHREFTVSYMWKGCQWNGPSWPFSTCVTLTGLANLLNEYQQDVITRQDYFDLLAIYTRSHHLRLDDGPEVPWIDENLNPFTGDWLTRTTKKLALGVAGSGWKDGEARADKGEERGKDYNHSTYCDLIINGLIGLRPRGDNHLIVSPLTPDEWTFFCLDRIAYHGHNLTILYDKTGCRYQKGKGLRIYCDGVEIANIPSATRIEVDLPLT